MSERVDFSADSTEAWVSYLGATRDEFVALQELVSTYLQHFSSSDVPLVIVDQSQAVRSEMERLGSKQGPVMLPVHERQEVELETPNVSQEEIRDVLETLQKDPRIQVRRTQERFFHSQCINEILHRWSDARFVLLFDSDSRICKGGLLEDLANAYPRDEWTSITAAGRIVDFVDSTRRTGLRRNLRRLFGLEKADTHHARRWRLPRLHPYCLLINRELVHELGIDFRLLFLDSLEVGWADDPLRAGRIVGDTGSSLIMQSAYHGLRVGDFPMQGYVEHGGRASHRPRAGRPLRSTGWW